MSLLKQIIRREVRVYDELRGTMVSQRTYEPHNAGASPVWTGRVKLSGKGTNRVLDNVIIKALNGQRRYAEQGMPVVLRRNAQGEYQVIGPSDRITGVTVLKTYAIGGGTPITTANLGFTIEIVPFEFYGDNNLWNDGVTPFPLTRVLNGAGNPV